MKGLEVGGRVTRHEVDDKVLGEWKCKEADLLAELDACISESRNYSSEVFHLKAAYMIRNFLKYCYRF